MENPFNSERMGSADGEIVPSADFASRYPDLEIAWNKYKNHQDMKARDYIAQCYMPLVEKIARRIHRKKPNVLDFSDLVQSGTIGLLDAINKFDPKRKILFSTYAPVRIQGSIYDDINKLDWTPRSVRERIKSLIKLQEAHENQYGVLASPEEIAKAIDMPLDEVLEGLYQMTKTFIATIDTETVVHLETELQTEEARRNFISTGIGDIRNYTVEGLASSRADIEIIFQVINEHLSPEEAQVILSHFYGEHTLKEIAEELNVSIPSISRLRKSGIEKLRAVLDLDNFSFHEGN